ncbi:hypothetical protein COF80_20115 [Bacillus toyonensis]|nr:hypothetical protein CN636_09690 [Bacillus toyonensis]PHE84269.1 hypothetical protein COF80_20115 [Bacillus toyonensis]
MFQPAENHLTYHYYATRAPFTHRCSSFIGGRKHRHQAKEFSFWNYSPLNLLMDGLKWEIPNYRNLTVSNSVVYLRSSYG